MVWVVCMCTWLATPRCVTGMAASKGAENAEETPGMICDGKAMGMGGCMGESIRSGG